MTTNDLIPQVSIPEGSSGRWKVERFTLDEAEARFANLKLGARPIFPGTYTRLTVNGAVMMSDTPAERRDHMTPVRFAQGHCLVNGLGLGMVASAMARRPEVERVTVIENSPDVIALVAPYLDPKIEVIEADAHTWQPPRSARYAVVWHDIWQDICLDDLDSRTRLKRRYARRWKHYHGAWADHEIARQLAHERANPWRRSRYA